MANGLAATVGGRDREDGGVRWKLLKEEINVEREGGTARGKNQQKKKHFRGESDAVEFFNHRTVQASPLRNI